MELTVNSARFDKVLNSLTEKKRKVAQSTNKLESRNRRTKSYFETLDFKIGSRHRDMTPSRMKFIEHYEGPPMIDTKEFKQRFLRGDKDAVLYQDPNEPKMTSY